MSSETDLPAHLRELEESLLDPTVRRSGRVETMLSDTFVEFGSSGRTFTKAEILAALQAELPVRISASEFAVRLLSANTALVTYRACRHSEPPVYTLRSSIWQRQQERWQMIFHQGTRIPGEPGLTG